MPDITPGFVAIALLFIAVGLVALMAALAAITVGIYALWSGATEGRLRQFVAGAIWLTFLASLPFAGSHEWIGWVALGSGIYSLTQVLGFMFSDGDSSNRVSVGDAHF